MKTIIYYLILFSFLSCIKKEKKFNEVCEINLINKNNSQISQSKNCKILFKKNLNVLSLSIENKNRDSIYFNIPIVLFTILENKNFKSGKDEDIVKPFIKNIFVEKIITKLVDKKRSIILNIDSTNQRSELPHIIGVAPGQSLFKDFYLNCEKSDNGIYEIVIIDNITFNKKDQVGNKIYNHITYPPNNYIEILKQ